MKYGSFKFGACCLLVALAMTRIEEVRGLAVETDATLPNGSAPSAAATSGTPQGPCDGFRQLLKLAYPDDTYWAAPTGRTSFTAADLPLMQRLLFRLRQVETGRLDRWTQPAPPVSAWLDDPDSHRTELAWITGKVRAVEEIRGADSTTQIQPSERFYRCELEIEPQRACATVITANVPKRWLVSGTLPQPVRLRGLLLGTLSAAATGQTRGDQTLKSQAQESLAPENPVPGSQGRKALLLLTAHLAWFPTQRAPPGQLFLAAHGVDIALLDEVHQRQPWVKPGVSQEGEAFYACLAATGQARPGELASLARQILPTVTRRWDKILTESKRRRQTLQKRIVAARGGETWGARQLPQLERKRKATDKRIALASAVLQRASQNGYSIAPLFLEPQAQVGCLTMVEGVARRAVKIVIGAENGSPTASQAAKRQAAKASSSSADKANVAQPAAQRADQQWPDLVNANPLQNDSPARPGHFPPAPACYYELEVFTADSQNLPVVCCISRLPEHFPCGDSIREPVRVAGVFFKSWLYRTRQTKDHNRTGHRSRLSVPIVIGAAAERQPASSAQAGRWPLAAGIGFLTLMAALWATMIWHARRDRRTRQQLRIRGLPATGLTPQWLDTHEDRSP